MKRLIWLPVAGFLLIAGAAVAAAAPGIASTAASLLGTPLLSIEAAGEAAYEPSLEIREGPGGLVGGESLLDEVLAELVTQGVITQEQSDAIVAALEARAEERRAEFEAEREQMQEMWSQIRTFLEDGVITADEIAQLPADNPFSNLEGILEDGQVTLEELQSIRPFGGFGPGRGHHGPGHFFFDRDLEEAPDSDTGDGSGSGTDSGSDSDSDSSSSS